MKTQTEGNRGVPNSSPPTCFSVAAVAILLTIVALGGCLLPEEKQPWEGFNTGTGAPWNVNKTNAPYWISNENNTAYALFNATNGSTWYIYENGSTEKSSMDDVMIFGDDFNGASINASKWALTGGAANSVTGGYFDCEGAYGGAECFLNSKFFYNGSGEYHVLFSVNSADASTQFIFATKDYLSGTQDYSIQSVKQNNLYYLVNQTALNTSAVASPFAQDLVIERILIVNRSGTSNSANASDYNFNTKQNLTTALTASNGNQWKTNLTMSFSGAYKVYWIFLMQNKSSTPLFLYGTKENGSWTINNETYTQRTPFNISGGNFTNQQIEINMSRFSGRKLLITDDEALTTGTLTVNFTTGGTAIGNASGFTPPSNLTINATPIINYSFFNWTTNCNGTFENPSSANTQIQINNVTPYFAQANFIPLPPVNLSVAIARNYTSVNLSCFQPYMNNSQPNGQDIHIPIFNVSNIGTGNYTNITLALNMTLPAGFKIYAQTANYVNPSSISLNTTGQTIIRKLLINQSKGIWLFGYCAGVLDNSSINLNFTFGGG
ncbi:Uncharacterised protein [Candidatus Anstonella stagnisolia]|nr:Uncharacterised protein [Candidatus Anstonella stagnisolia]